MRWRGALSLTLLVGCTRAPAVAPAVDVDVARAAPDAGQSSPAPAPTTRLVSHMVNGQVFIEEVPVEPGAGDGADVAPTRAASPVDACTRARAEIEAALAGPVDHRVVSAARELARACGGGALSLGPLATRLDERAARASSLRREIVAATLGLEETAPRLSALGRLADAENDGPGAIDALRRAVALAPGDPHYQRELAELERRHSVEHGFDSIAQEHFVARFEGEAKKDLAWDSLGILDEAWRRVGDVIDVRPAEPITVVFYVGAAYEAATGARDWSGGQFDGKIRVRAGALKQGQAALRDLLFHEYLHAAVATSVRRPIPAWLHEGLAQRLEPNLDRQRALAPLNGRARAELPSLDELSRGFGALTDHQQVRLYYACALDVVDELARWRGERSFAQLFEAMNAGKGFEAAFNEVYQLDQGLLEARWRGRY